jgi:hypothetical protein
MIEVLKQALEALKDVGVLTDREWQAVHKNKANELRQAIAQLESQEPVACGTYQEVTDTMNALWAGTLEQVQIAEEMKNKKLYTASSQRTWQGLTDEEIKTICLENGWDSSWQSLRFAQAIEAKLKEKNCAG